MTPSETALEARKISDRVGIVDIRGDFTAAAEGALTAAYAAASTGATRAIVLNFTGLEYMNSSGIGLLVTLLIRMNRQKQRLFTYGLSEHYRHIFELTRLADAIGIFDTEGAALAVATAE
jgi:anti-sigma B factor antagonist